MELEPRIAESTLGFTLLFVGVFVLLTLSRFLYPKRFIEFVALPINDKYFALEGKNYEIGHPFHILLFIVQWVAYATFIYLFILHFKPELKNQNWLYLQVFTGFGAFVFFKFYFEKLVAHVFMIEQIAHRYLFEKLNYSNFIALFLLVLNMFLIYTIEPGTQLLYGCVAGIILLHLISLVSSIKRNYQLIFKNIFYFILYLCALEIAPYIIVYKLIS